jgi:hypothetical protein
VSWARTDQPLSHPSISVFELVRPKKENKRKEMENEKNEMEGNKRNGRNHITGRKWEDI